MRCNKYADNAAINYVPKPTETLRLHYSFIRLRILVNYVEISFISTDKFTIPVTSTKHLLRLIGIIEFEIPDTAL